MSDADGDGRGDLLVGAYREGPSGSPFAAGRAYLFSGASSMLLLELASANEESSGQFGWSVAGVPDTDGDGRSDLLVGAYQEDPGASPNQAGRAYLFSGASGSGFDLTATATTSLTVAPGGSVQFAYTVTNGTDAAVSGDLYYVARNSANATVASGVITSGTLGAGETTAGTFTQRIPNAAPADSYTYEVRIGQFPSAVADTETFTIVVTPAARAAGRAEAWAVTDASPWAAASPSAATHAESAEAVAAFPNPFRSRTALRFALAEAGPVRLAVYDVLGREVAVLAEGAAEAGRHEATFDGSGLPAGVYLWRLEAGGRVETGRLTLTR